MTEVNGKKSTSKAKLKANSHDKRRQEWKEHFKNLQGNPFEISDKPTEKMLIADLISN